MNTKTVVILSCCLVALGALLWQSVPSAVAGEEAAVTAVVAMVPAFADKVEYEGSSKCKMCHRDTYKSWETTPHGKAFEVLMPGNEAEAKKKAGLDPEKDYSKDKACLACHTVGYGEAGGYEIPDEGDKKAVRNAKRRQGVGCESCHGPGSEYIDFHKTIQKEKKSYKQQEMYDAGMNKITADTCTKCHNDKSPTFKEFKFEEAMKKAPGHEHVKLEHREG